MKKLNWLDKFAQEQAKKEQMTKTASTQSKAKKIIVSPKDVPQAADGKVVKYKGQKYRVVQASYSDEKGPGVVLAAYEGLENNPMGLAMGVDPATIQTTSTKAQEYARTKLDIQQTYTNDEDAEWAASGAIATQQQIDAENSMDRTTVPGHYSKSPKGVPAIATEPVLEEVELDLDAQDVKGEQNEPNLKEVELDLDAPQSKEEVVEVQPKVADMNEEIIDYTKKLASAMTAEIEESLAYAESVIKRTVPARFAKTTLASLEKALDKEGMEVAFDKTITKQALKKTASEQASKEELVEVRDFVNNALVGDVEDLLKEADELMDEQVHKIAKTTKSFGLKKIAEIEHKTKSMMERRLKSIGIYARFERKYQVKK